MAFLRSQFRSQPAVAGRLTVALLLAASLWGCDQPAPERTAVVRDVGRIDTVRLPDSMAPPLAESTYDPALGALLLLPHTGVDGRLAEDGVVRVAVLSPLQSPDLPVGDTTGLVARLRDSVVTVLSREGLVGEFVVALESIAVDAGTPTCTGWPMATLRPMATPQQADSGFPGSPTQRVPEVLAAPATPGQPTPLALPSQPGGWTVAFPAGRATPVPLQSIERLPSRDSSTLAAAFARVASALPSDSMSPFRGLPFTVTRGYRSTGLAEGFALGVLVRRVPQEDSPLEEQIVVLLAMRGPDPRRWTLEWSERFEGREEEVIATELLAMVQTGRDNHLALLLGRDDGSGTAVALLEREGERWAVRWESPVSGC